MTRFESKLRHLFSFLFFSFLFFSFLFLFLLSFALNFAHVCVRVSALRLVLQLLQLSWVRGVSIDLWVNFYQIWTNLLTPPNVASGTTHFSAPAHLLRDRTASFSGQLCAESHTFQLARARPLRRNAASFSSQLCTGSHTFQRAQAPTARQNSLIQQSQYHLWRAPR